MKNESKKNFGLMQICCIVLSVVAIVVCTGLFLSVRRYAEISVSLILALLLLLIFSIALHVELICLS